MLHRMRLLYWRLRPSRRPIFADELPEREEDWREVLARAAAERIGSDGTVHMYAEGETGPLSR